MQDRLAISGPQHGPLHDRLAVAISALLHAALISLLLLRPGQSLPPPVPPLEIEMVQQTAATRGAPLPPAAAPATETPPAPQAPSSAAAVSPAPTIRRQAAAQAPAPEVNLGDSAKDLDPLIVTGDNIVPAGPDARYRNLPPNYPAAAARVGAEGTVQLVAHISPSGLPLSVGVIRSSGTAALDEEARRAVLLWRFRPARESGRAVPYDYVVDIRFAIGDR